MSLKSVVGDTCALCAMLAIGAMTLLAITWTMILVSNYSYNRIPIGGAASVAVLDFGEGPFVAEIRSFR